MTQLEQYIRSADMYTSQHPDLSLSIISTVHGASLICMNTLGEKIKSATDRNIKHLCEAGTHICVLIMPEYIQG